MTAPSNTAILNDVRARIEVWQAELAAIQRELKGIHARHRDVLKKMNTAYRLVRILELDEPASEGATREDGG